MIVIKKFTYTLGLLLLIQNNSSAQRIMESLDRGLVAVKQSDHKVYIGWRLLVADPANVGFNVYRSTANQPADKINKTPITISTNFIDSSVDAVKTNSYFVKAIINGKEQPISKSFVLQANTPVQQYLSVPLQIQADKSSWFIPFRCPLSYGVFVPCSVGEIQHKT